MQVALVHARSSWTGGTERYLTQLASELVQRGHGVHIVCKTHRGAALAGAQYHYLRAPALGGAWRLYAFGRAVEQHVRRASYDVVLGLGKTWTHDVIRLGGGIHERYLELAHLETLSPLERRMRWDRFKHRAAIAIEERALRPGAYRRIITNSAMVQREVCARHGAAAQAVAVIYNGVDLTRFDRAQHVEAATRLRGELELQEAQPLVLFLGTGYGRKGLDLVLAAFPALRARYPKAALVVAGFDSAEARYRARAAELGLASCTRFLGGRPDAERIYAMADIYVLPTRYDPFANTTLEALASGLPVLTSDTNGAAELLSPGLQGVALPYAELGEALRENLLRWAEKACYEAARGPARALAEAYPAQRTAACSADLLEQVATAKAAVAPTALLKPS